MYRQVKYGQEEREHSEKHETWTVSSDFQILYSACSEGRKILKVLKLQRQCVYYIHVSLYNYTLQTWSLIYTII